MLVIDDVIQCDERYPAANALPDSLGDRYLYTKNFVFRSVREAVLAAGYRFSSQDSVAWRRYQVFPLLSLRDILESRVIPYFDNLTVLRSMTAEHAQLRIFPKYFVESVKKNYVLHESAHCVASEVLRLESLLDKDFPSESEQWVLKSLVSECFANSVERLCAGYARSNSHVLFVSLNTYVLYEPTRYALVQNGLDTFGLADMFTLACLGFFHDNYTATAPDAAMKDSLFALAFTRRLNETEKSLAAQLVDVCFRINAQFREETSPNFFGLYGCRQAFEDLCAKDILGIDHCAEAIAAIAKRLAGMVIGREERAPGARSDPHAQPAREACEAGMAVAG
jgi:hypothetical protein